ncbi:hypothetical protein [Flavobacterium frigoris]|uniref:Collagen-like protein n=1 Tax=Flavobacterium frigoris TaxID=229204 RepID=A0A1H9J7D1_FLAFI|nr:hypothetical protein [Flavobacterium frigoris]SEQ82784.1 hypothetical protein SAMN05444355_104235 [Flavobacterium frigoris]
MKKIITLLGIFGAILFSSCTGPEGPPGYDGLDGQNGQDGLIAEVFEVGPDFTLANGYKVTYALNPKIYSGGNLLIYELINTNGGIDTWALLPQIYYFAGGTAQYNYNFSFDQFTILIDANFDRAQLPTSFRLGKTFRVVIIPGDDGVNTNKSVIKPDYSDYNAVIKRYNIDDSNVKKRN